MIDAVPIVKFNYLPSKWNNYSVTQKLGNIYYFYYLLMLSKTVCGLVCISRSRRLSVTSALPAKSLSARLKIEYATCRWPRGLLSWIFNLVTRENIYVRGTDEFSTAIRNSGDPWPVARKTRPPGFPRIIESDRICAVHVTSASRHSTVSRLSLSRHEYDSCTLMKWVMAVLNEWLNNSPG